MNLQPTLQNELLSIRQLRVSDLESLFQIAKDPKIWDQHPSKRYLRPVFEKFFSESIESKGALIILDKSTNRIIGSSRYKRFEGFANLVEIGWSFLDRAYWGGKYNKAFKRLMIGHAFKFVNTIIFYVDKTNFRSQRAVEKIGGQKITAPELEQFPKTSLANLTFAIKKNETANKTG